MKHYSLIIPVIYFTLGLNLFAYADEKVNLLGEWQYSLKMDNHPCEGKIAKGTLIFNTKGSNRTTIGDVTIKGDTFMVDGLECKVVPFSSVLSTYMDTPAIQDEQQFAKTKETEWNQKYVKKAYFSEFSNTAIVEVVEYTYESIVTWSFTR